MRLPLSSHAVAAALALLVLGAGVARSRTVVVDPGGSGDFTSIQAAIDSLFAWRTGGGPPDTAIVRAGTYEETITTHDGSNTILVIVCPDGPERTRLRGVAFPPYPHYGGGICEIEGLSFIDRVSTGMYPATYWFRKCQFEGGYLMPFDPGLSHGGRLVTDCVFRDTTRIVLGAYGLSLPLRGLHFIAAPAYIRSQLDGDGALEGCTFEGPIDTLVFARPFGDTNVQFEGCTFRNAGVGLAKDPLGGALTYSSYIGAGRCTFENLQSAIAAADMPRRPHGAYVSDSRFTNCGRAIDWGSGAGSVVIIADTIETSGDQAIRVASHNIDLRGLVFGSGSGGIAARLESWPVYGRPDEPGMLSIQNCSWTGAMGPVIDVVDTVVSPRSIQLEIRGNTIRGSTGPGIHVRAPRALIRGNAIIGSTGDGIALTPLDPVEGFTVDSNTVVRNTGAGIRVADSFYQGPRLFRHNLVARNGGAGLAVGGLFAGSVAFNDAWQNSGGDYLQVDAPLDSNLSVNPLFCDFAAGDFALQFGSPCGAGGVYGLIGALPEACVSAVGAPAAPVTTAAFSIHPNPARGEVAFTPPATGGNGTIEVLDLQGRRMWSSAFRAGGAPVRWRGDTANGRAGAGLYWVRIARSEGVQSRRLVWLN